MQTLREIVRLFSNTSDTADRKIDLRMKRFIIPAGSNLEVAGLFSISRSQNLTYYIGKLPEAWAIVRWAVPGGTSESMFHEEQMAKDIAALLSYVFHKRIITVPEVSTSMENSQVTTFIPTAHMVDSRLYAPVKDKPEIIWTSLKQILSLRSNDEFDAITNAIRLYQTAVSIAETDYSAGYILLVSAMESLATTFEESPAAFDDWSEAVKWNAWITEMGLDATIAASLRCALVDSTRIRLRQRFISLGIRAATEEFWTAPWERSEPLIELGLSGGEMRDMQVHIDEKTTGESIPKYRLRKLLANTYDHRSSFVHAGFSFPSGTSLDSPKEIEFESKFASDVPTKVSLPSFAWFERLVWFAISTCLAAGEKDESFALPDVIVMPAKFN